MGVSNKLGIPSRPLWVSLQVVMATSRSELWEPRKLRIFLHAGVVHLVSNLRLETVCADSSADGLRKGDYDDPERFGPPKIGFHDVVWFLRGLFLGLQVRDRHIFLKKRMGLQVQLWQQLRHEVPKTIYTTTLWLFNVASREITMYKTGKSSCLPSIIHCHFPKLMFI